jgi:hypothetical protein
VSFLVDNDTGTISGMLAGAADVVIDVDYLYVRAGPGAGVHRNVRYARRAGVDARSPTARPLRSVFNLGHFTRRLTPLVVGAHLPRSLICVGGLEPGAAMSDLMSTRLNERRRRVVAGRRSHRLPAAHQRMLDLAASLRAGEPVRKHPWDVVRAGLGV